MRERRERIFSEGRRRRMVEEIRERNGREMSDERERTETSARGMRDKCERVERRMIGEMREEK